MLRFDTLAGMALFVSRRPDVILQEPRLLGAGGQTRRELGQRSRSGPSIKPRRSTMQAWQRSGIDSGELSAGLDAVEKRLRLEPPEEDLLRRLGDTCGSAENSCVTTRTSLFEVPLSNAAMSRRQHASNPHRERAATRGSLFGLWFVQLRLPFRAQAPRSTRPTSRTLAR